MKTRFNLFFILLLGIAIVLPGLSCKKDKEEEEPPPVNNNPVVTPEINKYTASGSYGDVIRYEIDETNHMLKYYNETTGVSDSGAYTATNNANINGVFEVVFSGTTYYVVELAEKVVATSLPSGRLENKLCFGLSADLDLSNDYTMADLSGKYLFINYHDFSSSEIWGGYELFSNGTYTWNLGPADETNFDVNTHFSGAGSGTWSISSTDPSRVIFSEGGVNFTGTIYPGKAMLIDNGVGQGYTIGINYPSTHVTQSSVAGSYRILDIATSGETGVGTYTIPSSGGNLSYYVQYNGATGVDAGTSTDFAEVAQVNNMFKVSGNYSGETFWIWFVILPGEVMLHFCVGESTGLVSYGVGAKIN